MIPGQSLPGCSCEKGCQTLAIWRTFIDRVSPITCADRFHPLRMLLGQVLHCDESAILLKVINHCPGDFTPIERVAATGCKRSHCSGHVGLAENLAGPRSPP